VTTVRCSSLLRSDEREKIDEARKLHDPCADESANGGIARCGNQAADLLLSRDSNCKRGKDEEPDCKRDDPRMNQVCKLRLDLTLSKPYWVKRRSQMTQDQKIIKNKLGLLKLAQTLVSVSEACKVLGFSRDSFYRFREARRGGVVYADARPWNHSTSRPETSPRARPSRDEVLRGQCCQLGELVSRRCSAGALHTKRTC